MRSNAVLAATCLALVSTSLEAIAAPENARSSTQFTLRRGDPGGADAARARERARAGDCDGALSSFDAAIRGTTEPTLRRDRGLCHEKLGHVFPAIDDYRAYLVARPEAADAEPIRERLARLEEQAAASREGKESDKGAGAGEVPKGAYGGATATATMSVSTSEGPSVSASSSERARADMKVAGRDYEEVAAEERRAEDAEESPLRYGSGFAVGAYLQVPRFVWADGERVNGETMSAFGVTLRYAFGPTVSFVGDVGWTRLPVRNTSAVGGGPQLFAGLEARIPISRFATDQILLGGGAGYEHYGIPIALGGVALQTAEVNFVAARLRAGYRHVFGARVGLEAFVDGGPGYFIPSSGDSSFALTVGGTVALVIGF
jgi:hypothetical protein